MTNKYDPNDATNPAHYRDPEKGECIDALPEHFSKYAAQTLGVRDIPAARTTIVRWMMLGFCVGNAFKYRWRRGRKDDVAKEDAKAKWYGEFAVYILGDGPDPRDGRTS